MAKFETIQEVQYSYDHIAANSSIHGDCLVYGSAGKYHSIKIHHFGPGRQIRLYAHRLALLNKIKELDIPKDLEASHLCHEKACIKMDHIEAEPRHINMARIPCMNERRDRMDPHFCFGHPGYPDCV